MNVKKKRKRNTNALNRGTTDSTHWMIKNIKESIKRDFMALAKMKGFRTVSEALEIVLSEWIKNETGVQLWKRMGRANDPTKQSPA